MSDIAPIGRPHAAGPPDLGPVDRSARNTSTQAPATRAGDRVELSPEAKRASAGDLSPRMKTLTGRLKAEIATGTYETNDKVEGAIDKLAEHLPH